ncbi:MAG: DUF547 domain-containing protein [Gemmatimonadota bacterium]
MPRGTGRFDHSELKAALDAVDRGGLGALQKVRPRLDAYRRSLRPVDPDALTRNDALAYWINLYNAEILALALDAHREAKGSVFELAGSLDAPRVTIAGEPLSLDDIEHGKVRRFKDPRVHAALVCGSASCPTLRAEPYVGERIEAQLHDQMCRFLAAGGAVADRERNELGLSRIFLWYGSDFVHPSKMAGWRPVRRRAVALSLRKWLAEETSDWITRARPRIVFQPYDWSLACSVGGDGARSGAGVPD